MSIARSFLHLSSPAFALPFSRSVPSLLSVCVVHACAQRPCQETGFAQHDAIKWRLHEDMKEVGMRTSTEVFGLFSAVLPQPAQHAISSWPKRKRQGIVPDFRAAVPGQYDNPSNAVDELLELKTLHYGSSTYPLNTDERCAAVNRRADAIPH